MQLEELEGAFADFEEYTVELTEKRTSLYEAFEQRKVALVEQRNRKSSAQLSAAERILKVIQNRLAGFKTVEDINTYMASDLMIAKVREIIGQLLGLGDSVKADDLQGRLKSVQQEAVRQLKDRNELFAGGSTVIQLGKHRFNINTQPLDLTVVNRDGVQHIHLTSTKYFEAITDEAFNATRDVWDQEVVSENRDVYRGEYLAWQLLKAAKAPLNDEQRVTFVQEYINDRYHESYTKGIHDLDGERIFPRLARHAHCSATRPLPPNRPRLCAGVLAPLLSGGDAHTLDGQAQRLRGAQPAISRRSGAAGLHHYSASADRRLRGADQAVPRNCFNGCWRVSLPRTHHRRRVRHQQRSGPTRRWFQSATRDQGQRWGVQECPRCAGGTSGQRVRAHSRLGARIPPHSP